MSRKKKPLHIADDIQEEHKPRVLAASDDDITDGLFNKSNPYNLWRLWPSTAYKEHIDSASAFMEEYSFEEIQKKAKEELTKEDLKLLDVLKVTFWYEYDIAIESKRELAFTRIFFGQCGRMKFNRLTKNPLAFSYMLFRPQNDEVKLKTVINRGYSRLLEVLDMDIVDFKGRPNIQLIKEIREIYKMADMRLNGGIVQKLHQTSLNVNADKGQIPQLNELTDEQIEQKLIELQQKQNPNQLTVNTTAKPIEAREVRTAPVIDGETEEN
tara:strand:+ start:34274 stop:35080 length:807 start_codon:yes stop_codon:yes gene_type:complete